MKFYDCATAPSPRRVRMFIAEKGIAGRIETVEVNLREGEHLGEAYRRINPYCTTPALVAGNGATFTSTHGCWRYLEEAFPEPPLMGSTPEEKATVEDMIWRIECDGFMAVAEVLRNSAPGLQGRALTGPYSYAQIPALAERGRQRVPRFFEMLEGVLEDGRRWVAGDGFSAADIAAFVTVEFAARLDFAPAESAAAVHRWLAQMRERPASGSEAGVRRVGPRQVIDL